MKQRKKQNIKLGILVIAGILIFSISIYWLGKNQNLFDAMITLNSRFENVKGLKVGNNIRFSGINVGTVTDISIINDSAVNVRMSVKKDVAQFIKKDSEVEIENDGLVGNRIITIYSGSSDQPRIEKGDILQSRKALTTDDIIAEAQEIIRSSSEMAENLADVAEKLNSGTGDFARLLNDDRITSNLEESSMRLAQITDQLHQVTQKVNNGDGDMARFLNDDTLSMQLNKIIKELDGTSSEVNRLAHNLNDASEQISSGNSVMNKLLYDTTLAKQVDSAIYNVNNGLIEATKAASTIDESWVLNLFSKDKKKNQPASD